LCVLSIHCPVTTVLLIVEYKSIVSIASHRQQHEHSTAPTNMMRCPRSLGVVLYQYFFQLQPSFSSRNATPLCQSQCIGSNTSAPKASSPNSSNEHDVLHYSLCVLSMHCPVTTVPLIVECKSTVSIASHRQQHEHSTALTNMMRCPHSLCVV
jgi:hypothetical protein